MLREAVTTPYLNLVTRPTGVAVRGRIESVLATSEWETAMLDFSDVVLLDLSCADEVVAKLLRMAKERLGRIVALRGLRRAPLGIDPRRAGAPASSRWPCCPTGRSRCWARCRPTCTACSSGSSRRPPLRRRRAVAAARLGRGPHHGGARRRAVARRLPLRRRRLREAAARMTPPPGPLHHRDSWRAAPPARLEPGGAAAAADQHLHQPGRLRRTRCSTPATATTRTRSTSRRSTRCWKAPRRRCSCRAAWRRRRWRTSRCCAPATTSCRARGSTAARKKLFDEEFGRFGITVTYVAPDEPRAWRQALRPNTRAIFVETPTNPLMRVLDLAPIAKIARDDGIGAPGGRHLREPDQLPPARARRRRGHHQRHQVPQRAQRRDRGRGGGQQLRHRGGDPPHEALGPVDRPALGVAHRPGDAHARRCGWSGTTLNGMAVATWAERPPGDRAGALPGPRLPPGPRAREAPARRLRRHGRAGARRRQRRQRSACSSASSSSPTRRAWPAWRASSPSPGSRRTRALGPEGRAAMGIPDGFLRLSCGLEDADDLIADLEQALDG